MHRIRMEAVPPHLQEGVIVEGGDGLVEQVLIGQRVDLIGIYRVVERHLRLCRHMSKDPCRRNLNADSNTLARMRMPVVPARALAQA